MTNPLISVVLPVFDARDDATSAVRSVFNQTYRPLELVVVADETQHPGDLERLLAGAPHGIAIRIVHGGHANAAACLNAGLRAATGEYLAPITPCDEYVPQRLEACLAAARHGSVVATHLLPVGKNGKPLRISDPWRADYDRRLIHHIAMFPNVSCLSVFMDVVVTPGNLFFSRTAYEEIGEFADFPQMHHLDFFLRAALRREPALLRAKLLAHRPAGKSPLDEHAAVIRKHLAALWSGTPPVNPLADIFAAHPFLVGQISWTKAFNYAFNGLLEYRDAPPARVEPTPVKPVSKQPVPEFTLVTHELTLTGSPVIVLEMASLLRERGGNVRILSLKDGPLKAEFKRRGFRIVTPPVVLDRITQLHERTLHWALRGKRLPEKLVHTLTGLLRHGSERAWQLQLWLHAKGTLVINSIASWPLAARLPAAWKNPAYWYIHESLDPQWLMPGERANSRLKQLVGGGRLKILYGSQATRHHWIGNDYEGLVRYWSGVTGRTEYLGPASLRKNNGAPQSRRVILNVGSVSGRKGTRALVEAYALGRKEGLIAPDAELCIVGCPLPSLHVEARDLVARIHRPDLRGHVRVVHTVEPAALPSFYREADVYAHASIFDCMPLAVLTAMAHGLPIVTTDVDGCKEAIAHDNCGLLVQPGELRQMAEAIGRLLAQPEYAKKLGEAARARFIESFSAEATFPPLYDTLTGEPLPA